MAPSRPNHPPLVKAQCEKMLRQGTSVANVCSRLGVSKSYVKRVRAEINLGRNDDSDED